MKIAVIFGSHRRIGKNKEIEDMLISLPLKHELDIIRMADENISHCSSCYDCTQRNACVVNDDFQSIYSKMISADAIFIISPVYAVIPSKLTALFERLTSLLFASKLMNTEDNPLNGKPTAIFSYCSNGIVDETPIKLIFQKFVMIGYDFFKVNYKYINDCPKEGATICEYVKDVVLSL